MAEENSRAKILVKNTTWIYVGKLFTQLFGVIATILVIRKLAVDVFGTYNFLIKILLIYFVFALSPVMNLFNRYIPELLQLKDFTSMEEFLQKYYKEMTPDDMAKVLKRIERQVEKDYGKRAHVRDHPEDADGQALLARIHRQLMIPEDALR